jgi:cobalt-precorrin 5A hydrolase
MPMITIVSLTEPGQALAERLLVFLPDAEHLYRPQPFQEVVRERFLAGHRLILLCAVGIVVRTLGAGVARQIPRSGGAGTG